MSSAIDPRTEEFPRFKLFWHDGVVLQADTQSLFRGFGLLVQRVNAGSCCPLG